MSKNMIIPWLFLSTAVLAKDLPENFDFRKNPAFINLEASPAQRAEAERLILEKCPEQVTYLATQKKSMEYSDKKNVILNQTHKLISNVPQGEEYEKAFHKKLKNHPKYFEYLELEEADKKLMSENEKRYKTIVPCANEQRRLVSVSIPLFKDVGLTQPSGELRINFIAEPDEVPPIEFRLSSTDKWARLAGDFTPGGEWSYAYQTVLEKRGDKVLLPQKPFSTPVWFDFKKAFKTRLGESKKSLELLFIFDQKRPYVYLLPGSEKSVVPLRIEGNDGIVIEDPGNIRPDGEIWDNELIKKVIKKGKQKKIPIRNFFDKDEHIAASSQMGC